MKIRRIVFILAIIPFISHAELYKWVDANGQTHYSDKKTTNDNAKTIQYKQRKNTRLEITKDNIVGNWESKKENLYARVTIAKNDNFSGVVKKNKKVIWLYNGLWRLDNNKLIWSYKKSIPSLPPDMLNEPDVNIILALDENTMTLKEKNGKTTKYHRKK